MNPITLEDLRTLAGGRVAPCISILMPTHRARPDADQDPIRYRNLLRKAEAILGREHSGREIRALLEPLEALDTPEFWRFQADGLAVYRSSELSVFYQVPSPLPEMAVVADTFHIKPLLPLLEANRSYYVLALAQNQVTLYQGSPTGLTELRPTELPRSFQDALGYEFKSRFTNFHASSRASVPGSGHGGGAPAKMVHGHGGPEEDRKTDLSRFFRAVDKGLWELLHDSQAPLVLAGVAYYVPLYREVTRYRYITDESVEGNVEHMGPEELHGKAWPIVRRLLEEREHEAITEFERRVKSGRASAELSTIARAAVQGRVRWLMLAEGRHMWGRFDRETGEIDLHEQQQNAHDDDILDDVAEAVLLRGGDVLVMEPARLPANDGTPVVATFRW